MATTRSRRSTARERWIAAGVTAGMLFVTGEGLLVLVGILAAVQALREAPNAEGDRTALIQFAGLVIALALLMKMPVPGRRHDRRRDIYYKRSRFSTRLPLGSPLHGLALLGARSRAGPLARRPDRSSPRGCSATSSTWSSKWPTAARSASVRSSAHSRGSRPAPSSYSVVQGTFLGGNPALAASLDMLDSDPLRRRLALRRRGRARPGGAGRRRLRGRPGRHHRQDARAPLAAGRASGPAARIPNSPISNAQGTPNSKLPSLVASLRRAQPGWRLEVGSALGVGGWELEVVGVFGAWRRPVITGRRASVVLLPRPGAVDFGLAGPGPSVMMPSGAPARMTPARYIMVGGFLGAGKTTAILRMAEAPAPRRPPRRADHQRPERRPGRHHHAGRARLPGRGDHRRLLLLPLQLAGRRRASS